MGKITEALKKLEIQRQIQKQGESDKPKDAIIRDGQKSEITNKQETVRQSFLKEIHKNRAYIVKATEESGIDPCVITHFDSTAPISEEYRILRTNIQSKSLNKSAKTFLISSSLHGEGKTVTALNLAVALAQDLDKKVFLIDCDLRGGCIHRLLDLRLTPGLSGVLSSGTDSECTFQQSKIKNLTVLSRGEIPDNPSELLGSRGMKRLLEELKSRFDYIILDSPPVISLADAGILGAQTDGVIFIVQARKTQEDAVRKAKELLEQARAKIIGFVFTQVDYQPPDYYSHYYHNRKKSGDPGHPAA